MAAVGEEPVARAVGEVRGQTSKAKAAKNESDLPLDFGLRRVERSLREDITPPELTNLLT